MRGRIRRIVPLWNGEKWPENVGARARSRPAANAAIPESDRGFQTV
jgi:hypothetical protein